MRQLCRFFILAVYNVLKQLLGSLYLFAVANGADIMLFAYCVGKGSLGADSLCVGGKCLGAQLLLPILCKARHVIAKRRAVRKLPHLGRVKLLQCAEYVFIHLPAAGVELFKIFGHAVIYLICVFKVGVAVAAQKEGSVRPYC